MWGNAPAAVGVTWNTPKTRHEIITGVPNDDWAYNNALKELKRYKKTKVTRGNSGHEGISGHS